MVKEDLTKKLTFKKGLADEPRRLCGGRAFLVRGTANARALGLDPASFWYGVDTSHYPNSD